MKVTAIVVTSLNGKITNGDTPGAASWASVEDQQHFTQTLAAHSTLIMGSTTYEAAKSSITASDYKTRIVMTRAPERYNNEGHPASVVFTADSPSKVLIRLEETGVNEALLVGGGTIYSLFFDANLIDEVQLTLEPMLFPEGVDFTSDLQVPVNFEMVSCQQLNQSGTLLLRYKVINSA